MVLSKREKYIGIGTITAVVLLALNSLVVAPYFAEAEDLQHQLKVAKDTLDNNKLLYQAQKKRQPEWNAMLNNGLRADESTAQNRTQQLLQNWARQAGINLDNIHSERAPSQKGPFEAIDFDLAFNTAGPDSMRQIAKFLWSIESATVPVRLNSVRLQSLREGTDQLSVNLVVSALYMPGSADNNAGNNDLMDALEEIQ
jgi:hypothetical protein